MIHSGLDMIGIAAVWMLRVGQISMNSLLALSYGK